MRRCPVCGFRVGERVTMQSGALMHASDGSPVQLVGEVVDAGGYRPLFLDSDNPLPAACHMALWDDVHVITPLPNKSVTALS